MLNCIAFNSKLNVDPVQLSPPPFIPTRVQLDVRSNELYPLKLDALSGMLHPSDSSGQFLSLAFAVLSKWSRHYQHEAERHFGKIDATKEERGDTPRLYSFALRERHFKLFHMTRRYGSSHCSSSSAETLTFSAVFAQSTGIQMMTLHAYQAPAGYTSPAPEFLVSV